MLLHFVHIALETSAFVSRQRGESEKGRGGIGKEIDKRERKRTLKIFFAVDKKIKWRLLKMGSL